MGEVEIKFRKARINQGVECLDCIRKDNPICTVIWSSELSKPNDEECFYYEGRNLHLFIGFYNISGKYYQFTYSVEFTTGYLSLEPNGDLTPEGENKWKRKEFFPEEAEPVYSNLRQSKEYLEYYPIRTRSSISNKRENIEVQTRAESNGEKAKIEKLSIVIQAGK
jgi:hypothetical protein